VITDRIPYVSRQRPRRWPDRQRRPPALTRSTARSRSSGRRL